MNKTLGSCIGNLIIAIRKLREHRKKYPYIKNLNVSSIYMTEEERQLELEKLKGRKK